MEHLVYFLKEHFDKNVAAYRNSLDEKFATLSKLVAKGLHVAIAEPNLAHIVCQISPDELTIRVGYMNGHFVFLVSDLKQKARPLSTP